MSAPFITISECARRLGRPERTVRAQADAGRIPVAMRLRNGCRLFDAAAIEKLAAEQQARVVRGA